MNDVRHAAIDNLPEWEKRSPKELSQLLGSGQNRHGDVTSVLSGISSLRGDR
jgi:hypothetical protein